MSDADTNEDEVPEGRRRLPADPGGAGRPSAAAGRAARHRLPGRLRRRVVDPDAAAEKRWSTWPAICSACDGPELRRVRKTWRAWSPTPSSRNGRKQLMQFLKTFLSDLRRRRRRTRHDDGRFPGTLQPADALLRHRRGGPAPPARQPRDAVRLRRPRHGAGQRPGARRRRPSAADRPRLHRDAATCSGRCSSTSTTWPRTCPRPRPPPASSAPSTRASTSSRSSPTSTAPTSSNWSQDADLILDGTDNFEIRYLINDVAVKLGQAVGLRRLHRQPRPDDDDPAGRDAVPALRLRGGAGAGRGRHLRDGRRAGADRQHRRQLPGGRGVQDPRPAGATQINRELHLHRRVGEHAAPHQDRAAAGQGRLPVLPAAPLRVAGRRARARRRPACAAATPCRWRTARATKLNFEDTGPAPGDAGRGELQPLPAEVQRRTATSSRCSPTAGRSSRGPATWTRRGRCTRSTSGIEPAGPGRMGTGRPNRRSEACQPPSTCVRCRPALR